ncbi:MAG: DUF1906 domain-containing protein, partial [Deltaproteobacteria bacterium]
GSIVTLDMVTLEIGWAVAFDGAPFLLATTDGGNSWRRVSLPQSGAEHRETPVRGEVPPPPQLQESTGGMVTMSGQGFDTCEVPTLGQLQNWIANSPYRAVNLYIGGSARACSNHALSADFLRQAGEQGWKFIPTWVGPQAACSGYGSRMSYDPSTAYAQGRTEAENAANVAADLGLSPSVIYYDLEAYDTGNTSCRNAAASFISGWTSRLHERGFRAGAYGSGCSSALSDYATIANVPDDVWIAHWIYSSYTSSATVWDAGCVSNTLWSNHQRIRQYAGGHNEAWGGVTLNIDCNVIDGTVGTSEPLSLPQNAAYVRDTIPGILRIGHSHEMSITMQNTGQSHWYPWPTGHMLVVSNPEPCCI